VNLYVHFPFCRSKCAYCALHSSAGRTDEDRNRYVEGTAREIGRLLSSSGRVVDTLYFGGGTPALCRLDPVLEAVAPHLAPGAEFTVELNPLDAAPGLLERLKAGGVNRISMGVQSFDDGVLRSMGRPHDAARALEAWRMIRDSGFGNAGMDLICGWPGERRAGGISDAWKRTLERAVAMAPDHCSVYTLILEPGTKLARDVDRGLVAMPSDDDALAELAAAVRALSSVGLERYEISNFARPGMECRHNLAVWRGEDYTGVGDGACSREGGAVSRVIFRLRLLKEGFSPSRAAEEFPELAPRVAQWSAVLDRFVAEGVLMSEPEGGIAGTARYRLTPRGTEVCDAVLAELV